MQLFEDQDIKPYVPIARKYRPKLFSDIIGQDPIVELLKSAIRTNRVHHSILFTGTRGVGKTTMARILAKSINCLNRKEGESEPCNTCRSCISISEARNQDVIEIDAASNTSVTDVRVIIDNSLYRPVDSKYKVYIIDEVHMLSTSAFNALLKIIEEPPVHIKFILATTEYNKIPKTILSRCFKLFLGFVPIDVLQQYCRHILQMEGCSSDDLALKIIARSAQGSARDALSILDQAIILGNMNVTTSVVSHMLYFHNLELIWEIFSSISKGDVESAINNVESCCNGGMPPITVLSLLTNFVHCASQFLLNKENFDFEEIIRANSDTLKNIDFTFILRSWQVLMKGFEDMRYSPSQLQALEMLIIKLCYLNEKITPQDMLEQHEESNIPKTTKICTKTHTQNHTVEAEQQRIKSSTITCIGDILELLYANKELNLYNVFYHKIYIMDLSTSRLLISYDRNEVTSASIESLQNVLTKLTGLNIEISEYNNLARSVHEVLNEEKIKKKVK
ncbi:DNA polymerase III subunit gamma/tau [Candidatus Cyrtobacter comes]|uniref:DNA polymerase III subunit gamma/tau n=1 Tax=Candidatus Cyrtobacter comes TaxID=675776 RepID=A0ABU5L754_9RICK|nr:DNA polymerase III subunit gamma/tau [Candidatus Cyrtobacter comes]MDZ5761958.1 DNA polymerase III subunit gamma/tau [Candidatus Cyrtobacter comes]